MTATVGTLYIKTGCLHCKKVLDVAKEIGITFDERNVADEGVAEELIAKGGKKQEPYFVDAETGIAMYEADLITAYLRSHYGSGEDSQILGTKETHSESDAPGVCLPSF